MEGLSLDKFIEHHVSNSGWIVEKTQGKGQLVTLPRNEFNHPELKRSSADIIPLDHITRIFPVLGWFVISIFLLICCIEMDWNRRFFSEMLLSWFLKPSASLMYVDVSAKKILFCPLIEQGSILLVCCKQLEPGWTQGKKLHFSVKVTFIPFVDGSNYILPNN